MIQNDDPNAPATKADIKVLQDQISLLISYMGNLATKDELLAMEEKLRKEIHLSEERVLTAVEHRRYDDMGITNDRLKGHDQRIHALEVKVGI